MQNTARLNALDRRGDADDELTPAQINAAYDSITPLRYSEPTHLQRGKVTGLTITPYNAGHSFGGTIWKIRSPSSGTVLYALKLNHTRERTLDGTALVKSSGGGGGGIQIYEPLLRPDIFITDASRTLTHTPRRKDREAAFLDLITSTLSSRHSVLIPTALDARLLELLLLLDQHWSFARLRAPLCLVARNGAEMLALYRSLMDWFGGALGTGILSTGGVGSTIPTSASNKRQKEAAEVSPLALPHLEIFPSPQALLERYSSRDPKLVLATPLEMGNGVSKELFAQYGFGEGDGNVVLLTRSEAGGDIGGGLLEKWTSRQAEGQVNSGKIGQIIKLDESITVEVRLSLSISAY